MARCPFFICKHFLWVCTIKTKVVFYMFENTGTWILNEKSACCIFIAHTYSSTKFHHQLIYSNWPLRLCSWHWKFQYSFTVSCKQSCIQFHCMPTLKVFLLPYEHFISVLLHAYSESWICRYQALHCKHKIIEETT